MPKTTVLKRLERLSLRGYVQRRQEGGVMMLSLLPDPLLEPDSDPSPRPPTKPPPSARQGGTRSAQASLHSGMLRRPPRRQSGAIEFDDPLPPHPVVSSFLDSVQSTPGGFDGFRFWLKTILDPEDVEIFSGWAGRQSTEYRQMVRKFEDAHDDQTIESLLEDTLAVVTREKTPKR